MIKIMRYNRTNLNYFFVNATECLQMQTAF